MKRYDAIVIGGGVLGCFAARSLRRWNISTALLEAEEDVCQGVTRANSAIVYAGYDNKPHSLKRRLCIEANRGFEELCRQLEVPFSRCGSLMVSCGTEADGRLEKKLRQAEEFESDRLSLISGSKARELEPMLSPRVSLALYCADTGTVNPWKLGIAAYENALSNGAEAYFNCPVSAIEKGEGGYIIRTGDGQSFECAVIINCAGLQADRVQRLVYPCAVSIDIDGADFLVLDRSVVGPGRIIFQETEKGKGITAVPCVEGNLLLDSPPRPAAVPFATTPEGLELVSSQARELFPGLDMGGLIRSFGAARPNPRRADGKSINDFCIENPGEGFYSLIAVKTPGLSCADSLGRYLAGKAADYLSAAPNPGFDPRRRAIDAEDGDIICRCEGISRAAVLESIRRGAVSPDGVKRRVGTGMGRCQGSRCGIEIERILRDYRHGTL